MEGAGRLIHSHTGHQGQGQPASSSPTAGQFRPLPGASREGHTEEAHREHCGGRARVGSAPTLGAPRDPLGQEPGAQRQVTEGKPARTNLVCRRGAPSLRGGRSFCKNRCCSKRKQSHFSQVQTQRVNNKRPRCFRPNTEEDPKDRKRPMSPGAGETPRCWRDSRGPAKNQLVCTVPTAFAEPLFEAQPMAGAAWTP